jgi:hypothetical protein
MTTPIEEARMTTSTRIAPPVADIADWHTLGALCSDGVRVELRNKADDILWKLQADYRRFESTVEAAEKLAAVVARTPAHMLTPSLNEALTDLFDALGRTPSIDTAEIRERSLVRPAAEVRRMWPVPSATGCSCPNRPLP